MWRLDVFEGGEYERRGVRVSVDVDVEEEGEGGEGSSSVTAAVQEREAETYIWVAGAHRLDPDEWDFDEFVREKMERWVGRDAAVMDEGFRGKVSLSSNLLEILPPSVA